MVYTVPKPVSLGRRSVRCGERERTLRFDTLRFLSFRLSRKTVWYIAVSLCPCKTVTVRYGERSDVTVRLVQFVVSPFADGRQDRFCPQGGFSGIVSVRRLLQGQSRIGRL